MSAQEIIHNHLDCIVTAIGYLEDLQPKHTMSAAAIEDMDRRAKVHKDVIVSSAVALIGGLLTDINRIANALEESSKPAPLLDTE